MFLRCKNVLLIFFFFYFCQIEQILTHNQVKSAKVAFMRPPLPQKHDNHMRWALPAATGVFIYIYIYFPNAVTIIDFNTNMIRELASYFFFFMILHVDWRPQHYGSCKYIQANKNVYFCKLLKRKKDSLWLFMLFMLIGIVFYCLSSLIKAEVKWY